MKVISEINKILKLNDDQTQLIKSHLIKNTLNKNDQFLRLDSRNDKIGFIDKGLLRSFSYDDAGNEITHDFFQQAPRINNLNRAFVHYSCTYLKHTWPKTKWNEFKNHKIISSVSKKKKKIAASPG